MSVKHFSTFTIIAVMLLSMSSACATKKYVRTRVDERVTPVEGRTAELETGTRELRNRADSLEGRASSLEANGKQLKSDISDVDQRATQGINEAKNGADEAKNAATTARKDALAANDKVNDRVSNLDNWQESQVVVLYFKPSLATLTVDGRAKLDQLIQEIKGQTGSLLEVKGFTDSQGSTDANRKLSESRAHSVYQYLVEHDFPTYKIHMVGLGELKPVSDNNSKHGRSENRRVEIRVLINAGIKSSATNTMPN